MATAVKLNLSQGDVVELGARRYEVIDDREGGLAFEPATTTSVARMHEASGERELSSSEFDDVFGDIPADSEG